MANADMGGRMVYVDLKKPYGVRAAVRKKAREAAGDMTTGDEKEKRDSGHAEQKNETKRRR